MVRIRFYVNAFEEKICIEDIFVSEENYYDILNEIKKYDISIPIEAIYITRIFYDDKRKKFIQWMWSECYKGEKFKNGVFFLGHFISGMSVQRTKC